MPYTFVKDHDDNYLLKVNSDGSVNASPAYGLYNVFNKFGAANDFDAGDGEITIWDGAEDNTAWELMNYVYSTTAAIDTISSNAADTVDIEIQGLDDGYELLVQTVTLSGTASVPLTTPLRRIFRAKNVGSSNLAGHVFVYEAGATTGGVPDTNADIRCVVHPENNQTEMAIFTVPSGYTAYLKEVYVHTAGASRSAEYLYRLKARPLGQVFQLKYRGTMSDDVDGGHAHEFSYPVSFKEKTDIELTCEILTSAVTDATVIGGFDIVLVPN